MILECGKIILAGAKIILAGGKIILAGGKIFWQGRWKNYFSRWNEPLIRSEVQNSTWYMIDIKAKGDHLRVK